MEMTFSYQFKSSSPVNQVAEEVEITAVLENPEVWTKSVVLVPLAQKSGDFTITFPLDLDELTQLFMTIQEETGIPTSSPYLTIRSLFLAPLRVAG